MTRVALNTQSSSCQNSSSRWLVLKPLSLVKCFSGDYSQGGVGGLIKRVGAYYLSFLVNGGGSSLDRGTYLRGRRGT